MKKSGFKRKPTKPLKRGKLKKQNKQSISKIQRILWDLCKNIIRKKYGTVCYTCGRQNLSGSNWQTSHMWPKASIGAYLKYDLRLLRPACYHCNINLGGNGAVYYQKMLKENGAEYMEQLEKDRQVSVRAHDHYLSLIEQYKGILSQLTQ